MKWSQNNMACKTVWSALIALGQIDNNQSFKSTGHMRISDLRFFPTENKSDIIDVFAKSLASKMDKIFRLISYNKNISRTVAVTEMAEILKLQEQSVADLADKMDDQYLFLKEDV